MQRSRNSRRCVENPIILLWDKPSVSEAQVGGSPPTESAEPDVNLWSSSQTPPDSRTPATPTDFEGRHDIEGDDFAETARPCSLPCKKPQRHIPFAVTLRPRARQTSYCTTPLVRKASVDAEPGPRPRCPHLLVLIISADISFERRP
jgi:hypothetical protein